MILIVDSGATKADWTALNEKGMKEFGTQTLGLNPEVLTEEIVMERLTTNEQLNENRKRARHVYFYGAGCGTERLRTFLHAILQRFFSNATIVVKADGEKAIVGILGTGSNCSYWDGKELYQAVDSLGYSLMDECSGNFFGKRLIVDYYFKIMPESLRSKFEHQYELNSDVIKSHLYKLPNPNSYLATFGRFLVENKEDDYCNRIIKEGLQLFINHWVVQYEVRNEVPINFVGSIAFYLQDMVREVFAANGLKVGKILRKPIDGLVEYHLHHGNRK